MSGSLTFSIECISSIANAGPAPPLPIPQGITARQFRALLPEFSDSSRYLDETINMWLQLATAALPQNRWCNFWSLGLALFAAHNMTLGQQAALATRRGGVPGGQVGVLSSKSMGGVSAGYNTAVATLDKGGDWNLTTYGIRFLMYARMAGSGGIQIVGIDAAAISEKAILIGRVEEV